MGPGTGRANVAETPVVEEPAQEGSWLGDVFGSVAGYLGGQFEVRPDSIAHHAIEAVVGKEAIQAAATAKLEDMTPDEILTKMGEDYPDWKSVADEIKKDPALSASLKNSLVKDPTMLDGFMEMAENGNGQTKPADIASTLKDPKARKALGFLLDNIAKEDKYEFADFKRFMEGNRDQQMAQLGEMGFNPMAAMDMNDILGLVKQFLTDPGGTLNKMADMFATGPAQREAAQPFIDAAATAFGVILEPISGEEKGYGGRISDAISWGQQKYEDGSAQKFVDDITGETDKRNPSLEEQRAMAGTGNTEIAASSLGSNVQIGQNNGSLGGNFTGPADGTPTAIPAAAPSAAPQQRQPELVNN